MKALIAVLMMTAPFAHADADLDVIQQNEEACIEKNMSQIGMKRCANEAYTQYDSVLNADYKAMVRSLKSAKDSDNSEILKRLVASERAWVAFRDANCSYAGTTDLGGSNEGLDILSCLGEMTNARIKELRR